MDLSNPTLLTLAAVLSATTAFGALVVSVVNLFRVRELYVIVNSHMSNLLKLARAEGHAAGHAEGLAAGLELQKIPPTVTPPVVVIVPSTTEKKTD